MKLRLATREDWARIKDAIANLPFTRGDQRVRYRVIIEEDTLPRSTPQNASQHVWYGLAADQLKDDTAEGYRAYCKLHFGVPILREDSEEFRRAYDSVIKPLSYEKKIKAMSHPLDFPITRLMNKRQMNRYLDAVYIHLTGLGVDLERRAA